MKPFQEEENEKWDVDKQRRKLIAINRKATDYKSTREKLFAESKRKAWEDQQQEKIEEKENIQKVEDYTKAKSQQQIEAIEKKEKEKKQSN